MRAAVCLVAALLALAPTGAHAQADGAEVDTRTRDVVLTGGALLGALALSRIPTSSEGTWQRQLLPFDRRLEDDFSLRAARVSDVLLVTAVAAPLLPALAGDDDRDRTLVYAETLGANLLLAAAVKVAVRRPRPYLYSPDPAVRSWGHGQRDARQSFYSGHASTSFAAAVAGGLLTTLHTDERGARFAAWSSGFALAGATATLRTRAGKHFYSDVLCGALVGSALGAAIPLAHAAPGQRPVPTRLDLVAAAAGLGVGIASARLLPLGARLAPAPGGLALAGRF